MWRKNNNESNDITQSEKRGDENILLSNDENMPEGLREPFIKTGYRKPYSTTWQCIQSLFYINNESFNVWSHLFVTLYFVVRYTVALSEMSAPESPSYNFYYPMLSSGIGTVTVYLSSVLAHLFNVKSEKMHSICFFFDYAGISTYSFTSGQVIYYYTRPIDTQWNIFESPFFFTGLGTMLSFVAVYACCKSKVTAAGRPHGSVMKILPTFACWINSTISVMVGITLCSCDSSVADCKSFTACNKSLITYYKRHCFCSLTAAVLYGTYIPERFLPRVFDFIGNSHNFLHIFSALGTEYAFKILEEAVNSRMATRNEMLAKSLDGISAVGTVGPTIVVLFGNIAIAYWFAKSLKNTELNTDKKK